jgi:hypothetical protein
MASPRLRLPESGYACCEGTARKPGIPANRRLRNCDRRVFRSPDSIDSGGERRFLDVRAK